jgi:predicted regulator of Ras-like GTPase activity (Roadblock/LC7/MglB family)
MLRRVDAAQALADLTEISSQVVDVAIVDAGGTALASTLADRSREQRFVAAASRLLDAAAAAAETRGLSTLSQLEAATLDGSVFVVRRDGRVVVATTRPDPTIGLVFYDLKHCLAALEEEKAKSPPEKPRSRSKKADAPA